MTAHTLQCDMEATCRAPVTHVGTKGYIYCTVHAARRQAGGRERCRKMTLAELKQAREGKPLRYAREAKPLPPCAASMGCLCFGHARGADARAACDTSEHTIQPVAKAVRRMVEVNAWMRGGFAEGDRKAREWLRGVATGALIAAGYKVPGDRKLDKLIDAALVDVVIRRGDNVHHVKVTTLDGKVFACAQAGTVPSEPEVRQAWLDDRRVFAAFDESEGVYVR